MTTHEIPDVPDIRKHFGDNLRRIRRSRGVPVRELGERCGIGFSSIVDYEQGERLPDVKTLLKIATGLNVAPNDLLAEPAPRPWLDLRKIGDMAFEGYADGMDADAEQPAGYGDARQATENAGRYAALEVLDQLIAIIAPTEPTPDRIGWIREIRDTLESEG